MPRHINKLIYAWEWGWGTGEKHLKLQYFKLTFIFFSIKHIFRHFSCSARCEICSKLTIKTPEYINLTIKLKNKDTIDVVLVSFLLTLNTFDFLLQCFYC